MLRAVCSYKAVIVLMTMQGNHNQSRSRFHQSLAMHSIFNQYLIRFTKHVTGVLECKTPDDTVHVLGGHSRICPLLLITVSSGADVFFF